jgi:hypothetical protein
LWILINSQTNAIIMRYKVLRNLLDVIANSRQGELRAIVAIFRLTILVSHSAGTSVRAAQTVEANHKEPRDIKCLTWTSKKRAPPVSDIGAATKSMADHQRIVSIGGEGSSCGICDRNIV